MSFDIGVTISPLLKITIVLQIDAQAPAGMRWKN